MLKTYHDKNKIEAGCDEAGRGCLAGPVYAAAVILPPRFKAPVLNDSKQLTPGDRNTLRVQIEKEALAWAVAWVDHNEIDEINILNASFLAMHRAIDKLKTLPEFLLIDGNRFNPYKKIRHLCVINGDATYASIAAASILAKTHRDEYMEKLHTDYPYYHWDTNKGYPTPAHKKAIKEFGISPYHRLSFRLNEQMKLEL